MGSLLKVAGVALLVAACGSKLPATNTQQSSAVIGAAGGTVTSADGVVSVTIPAGALASDVTITVAPTTSPGAPTISEVYEIGPTGTQFATPATILFRYGSLNLGGTSASSLQLATFAGSWVSLNAAVTDIDAETISAPTMHLSPYALVAAGGPICATVSGGFTCTSSGAGGSIIIIGGTSSGAGGDIIVGGSSGVGGSGGTGTSQPASDPAVVCTPNTCAEAGDVCAPFGAKLSGCTDGPNGYTASCCFPQSTGICMPTGGVQACGGQSTPDGGYTSVCLPKPTCATATDACSQYSGATLLDCTDTDTGFTGSCCFATGHPVCTVASSGGGCTNPSPSEAVGCNVIFNCANTPQAEYCGPGTTVAGCVDQTDQVLITCCYPLGVLPGNGTPASVVDGGLGAGGVSGGGGLTGDGGAGGIGGSGGGSGGLSDGMGGVGPAPTGGGGLTGTGGLFGPGKGGTG
jgi:hypothetical protein